MTENKTEGASLRIHHNPNHDDLRGVTDTLDISSQYLKDENNEELHHIILVDDTVPYFFLYYANKLIGQNQFIEVGENEKVIIQKLIKNGDIQGKVIEIKGKTSLILTGVSEQLFKEVSSYNNDLNRLQPSLFSQLTWQTKNMLRIDLTTWRFSQDNLKIVQPAYKNKLVEILIKEFIEINDEKATEIQKLMKQGTIAHEFTHFEQNIIYFSSKGIGQIYSIYKTQCEKFEKDKNAESLKKLEALKSVYWKIQVFEEAQAILAETKTLNQKNEAVNVPTVYWRFADLAAAIDPSDEFCRLKDFLLEIAKSGSAVNFRGSGYQVASTMLVLGDFSLIEKLTKELIPEMLEKVESYLSLLPEDVIAFAKKLDTTETRKAIDTQLRTLTDQFIQIIEEN